MPRKPNVSAGDWMREHGIPWSKASRKVRNLGKHTPAQDRRPLRGKQMRQTTTLTIREFVEGNRSFKGHDCLFVPLSVPGIPASVGFCGSQISAARYMALLTLGAPKYEGTVVRHLCGNGHLSCVNPAHLAWGDSKENASDAGKHQHAGDDVQDRINAV